MINLFTRMAGLALAFGFFFGCSVLKNGSNKQSTSTATLSETQIKQQVADIQHELDSKPLNAHLLFKKGSLLTRWAQKKDDPKERTSFYFKADKALTVADSLSETTRDISRRDEIDQLRKVAWSNEHNQGVQTLQNASSEKNYSQAAIHFENATAIMPDSATSYEMASKAFYKSKQPQKAIAELERARVKAQSPSVDLLESLAFLYIKTNQPQKAIPIYKDAQTMTNHNLGIKHGLANAYIEANKHSEAIALLRQLAAQNPNNATYRQSLASELYRMGQQKISVLLSKAQQNKKIRSAEISKVDSLFEEAKNIFSFMLGNKSEDIDLVEESAQFYYNTAVQYQQLFPYLNQSQKQEISDVISEYLSSSIQLLEQLVEQKPQKKLWESLYQAYSYLGMEQKAQNAKTNF